MKPRLYAIMGLAGLVLNTWSFTNVGIEKALGYTPEQAAMVNVLTASAKSASIRGLYFPIYGIGFTLGHALFYEDGDYSATGERELSRFNEKTKQIMSDYISRIKPFS